MARANAGETYAEVMRDIARGLEGVEVNGAPIGEASAAYLSYVVGKTLAQCHGPGTVYAPKPEHVPVPAGVKQSAEK